MDAPRRRFVHVHALLAPSEWHVNEVFAFWTRAPRHDVGHGTCAREARQRSVSERVPAGRTLLRRLSAVTARGPLLPPRRIALAASSRLHPSVTRRARRAWYAVTCFPAPARARPRPR